MYWEKSAKCRDADTNIFFEDRHILAAKSYCKMCLVNRECLEAALERDDQFAVMGGMTVKERKRFKLRAYLAREHNVDSLQEKTLHEQSSLEHTSPLPLLHILDWHSHSQQVSHYSVASLPSLDLSELVILPLQSLESLAS